MKIIYGILLYLICISSTFANDTAEAIATVLDVVIDKHVDSSQIELGSGPILMGNDLAPEFHLGINNFFLNRFKIGVSVDIPRGDKNTADVNIGLTAGLKNFNPIFGRHYYNFTVGGSKFENNGGLYFEPSITFVLKESAPVRYFWIMNTFGINTSIAYRHIFIENNNNSLLNTNAVIFKVNVFIGQRQRKRSTK